MTGTQYEELCRVFLANQLRTSSAKVLSLDLESPMRPKLPPFAHQIDLYWEIEDDLTRLVHIANAKWHDPPNRVQMDAVLLVQQVRQQVGAHKAMLITNTDYAEGARAAAQHLGVGLHILTPVFSPRRLHATDPVLIRSQLEQIAAHAGPRPLYVHQVVHKGFGAGVAAPALPEPAAENLPAPASGTAAGRPWFAGPPSSPPPMAIPNKALRSGDLRRGDGFSFRTK